MGDIEQEPEVRRWFASAGYDAEGRGEERHQLLAELEAFCAYTGKTPGELVRSCLRTTKTGQTAISTKGRTAIQDVIEAFAADQGLTGHAAVVAANHIRGFLIHNGIFMQGRPSLG